MKKTIIVSAILTLMCATASAHELTVRAGQNTSTSTNLAGAAIGTQVMPGVRAEIAVDGFANNKEVIGRWAAGASYDVVKVMGTTVSAKAAAAYLSRDVDSGYALLAGVGVSYPVTKTLNVVADYQYQRGQDRVSDLDGNTVTVGIRVQF